MIPPGQQPLPAAERPLLRVRDLAVSFAGHANQRIRAVDGAFLSVFPGQTLAVVGESGCGKSVTAMSLLRLIPMPPGRLDDGSMLLDAPTGPVDLARADDATLRRIRGGDIAMIFQEPMSSLNPVFSVGEQILEAIHIHRSLRGDAARQVALDAMREVGIVEPERRFSQFPHQFSGGMRQRVMIAMALACQPRLLLADEPTTALDVTIQAQILELLRSLRRQRAMGVVLITHDMGVVSENADVVCVMYAGRVVEYAPVFELFRAPAHPYTRGLLASIPRLGRRRERLVTVRDVVDDPAQFRFPRDEDRALTPWWPWHSAPEGVSRRPTPGGDSTLVQVGASHVARAWRTPDAAAREVEPPDLSFRRDAAPGAA